MSLEERFNKKWIPEPFSGCWLWIGSTNRQGYGDISRGVRGAGSIKAHRLAYELYRGLIPRGYYVCHRCDTTICVNPDHLFLGSQKDNMIDCSIKNRIAHGENSGTSKVTKLDAIAIYKDPRPSETIARDYGISDRAVRLIKKRINWKRVLSETFSKQAPDVAEPESALLGY